MEFILGVIVGYWLFSDIKITYHQPKSTTATSFVWYKVNTKTVK